jgi:hypothetical protein
MPPTSGFPEDVFRGCPAWESRCGERAAAGTYHLGVLPATAGRFPATAVGTSPA